MTDARPSTIADDLRSPPSQSPNVGNRSLIVGIVFISLALALGSWVAYRNARSVREANQLAATTREQLIALERLQSDVIDAETGQRGFMITGDATYLEPHDRAVGDVWNELGQIKSLMAGEGRDLEIASLEKAIGRKLKELQDTNTLRMMNGFDAARDVMIAGDGKELMDEIRASVSRLSNQKQIELRSREQQAVSNYNASILSAALTASAAFLSLATFVHLLRRNLMARTGLVRLVGDQRERETALLENERQRTERLQHLTAAAVTINAASSLDSLSGVLQAEGGQVLSMPVRLDLGASPPAVNRCAPLVGRGGHALGHLVVDVDLVLDDDRLLLAQLANMAAVAVENVRLNDELRQSDRRKDEFLATLAHELRNPLAPIRNAIEILRIADDDATVRAETRQVIDRQVTHMVRLIDDLLDLARISSGKLILRISNVDVATVVNAALEVTRPIISDAGHELKLQLPSSRVALDADPVRVAQVLQNLLGNAAKYTERGGHISLTASVERDMVVFSVQDDGIGIPRELLPRVFDMFSQADGPLERSRGGLGIGLSLVRRLVEMHGGRVEARSDGLKRGSEFVVRLPVARSTEQVRMPVLRHGAAQSGTVAVRRVLVVDDNEDALRTLATLLETLGQDVRIARDGLEAVDTALAWGPDVVFLDLGLPRLNGYSAGRRIREGLKDTGLMLVAVTGWGHEQARRGSAEAGFDRHLVKPVSLDALVEILGPVTPPRAGLNA